jgi:cytochrome c oxidase subunit 2
VDSLSLIRTIPLFPDEASTVAGRVDGLFFFITAVSVFFSVLIVAVIFYFFVKYRRRSPDEVPRPIEGSTKLELTWTFVPFGLAMIMFIGGAYVYFTIARPPRDTMDIYVVGKQWMWKFQHSTGQREINELHVPAGRKVKLIMTSEDVIHDLFFPAFRTKADVVPGRYTVQWFEATTPGTYHLFCAEYCGMNHSGMTGSVYVMEPREFDNWLSGNTGGNTPAAAGQQLYQTLGCASCHGANGEGGRGPTLAGLFGRPTPLENGQTVNADEAYIRESILNPQAKIVAGFTPIMPTFQGQITEDQLVQLIAFIKSLPGGTGTAPGAASPATPLPTSGSASGSPTENRR